MGKELDHICIVGRWLWQQHERNLTGESGSRKWDRKLLWPLSQGWGGCISVPGGLHKWTFIQKANRVWQQVGCWQTRQRTEKEISLRFLSWAVGRWWFGSERKETGVEESVLVRRQGGWVTLRIGWFGSDQERIRAGKPSANHSFRGL